MEVSKLSQPIIINEIENRLKLSGGTLTGSLFINNGYAYVSGNADESIFLSRRNFNNEKYSRYISISSKENIAIDSSITFVERNNDVWKTYKLYGEHNKPTPGEIGAPSLIGEGASGDWNINITGNSNSANRIERQDTRSVNEAPIDMLTGLSIHLKGSNDGLDDGGTYHAAIHIKDWQDYSGGPFGQMAITGNSNFWFRVSTSETAWGAWKKVLDSSNYTSYTVTKTGSGASGTWPISISGSAAKLSSARNIALGGDLDGSANFDGSGNITISGAIANCNVSSNNTANYPWHRIATVGPASNSYNDYEMIIAVRHYFDGGGYGVAKVSLRTNLNSNCGAKIVWMYRYNISMDALRAGVVDVNGATYMDLYYYYGDGWARCKIHRLFSNGWNLINSNEVSDTTTSNKKDSYEVYTSVADGGSKIGRSYTRTITAEDGPVRPTSSGTSPMTANSSGLSTNHVYLQYT